MQVMPNLPKAKVGVQDRRFLLISSRSNSPRIFQLHKAVDYVPTLLVLDIGAGSFGGALEGNCKYRNIHLLKVFYKIMFFEYVTDATDNTGTKHLGDSQAWFIRQYIPKGFKLGRYIAWEEFPMNAERYFEAIPPEMTTKYTFFNTKISR